MNELEAKYHGILKTVRAVVADPAFVCRSNQPFEGHMEVAVLSEDLRSPSRVNFYDRQDRWLHVPDDDRWVADSIILTVVGPSLEDVLAQAVLRGLVVPTERPS